jgi:Mg-chelatase subunit ChlD
MLAVAAALLVAAGGLAAVRTATPLARVLAWAAALAFAVVLALDPAVQWDERRASAAVAELRGDATGVRTNALVAAGAATPAAADLRARWHEHSALPDGALGCASEVPKALPFQPEDLRVELLAPPTRDRPVLLQVRGPSLAAPLRAHLRVLRGGERVHEAEVQIGAASAAVTFVPALAGPHTVELVVDAPPHTVTATGGFEVGEAPVVLVLEPGGAIAAALRAQGVRVDEATSWAAAARAPHAAVVLGVPMAADAQQQLADAVRDGMGAFVLAPGFGAPGEPVRSLLPLNPLPQQPDASGEGAQSTPGGDPEPSEPSEPPPPQPDQPPRGDTSGASRPSEKPIEVDKHAIAMVLVIDRSGSMGTPIGEGKTKMSYAKTSALRTAQMLGEGDQVGVVTFGTKDQGRIVLPMTDATREAVVRAGIEKLAHASENTYLFSGLRKAYEMLAPVDAAVKHVVVISDGEWDTSEAVQLGSIAHRMRESNKVTLSLIAITDKDTDASFLTAAERLSKDGGGEFFAIEDARAVPTFVSAEVTRSLTRVGRQPRPGPGAREAPPTANNDPKPPPPDPTPPPNPPPKHHEPKTAGRVPVRAVAQSALLEPAPASAWPSLARAVAGTAPLDARVLLVAGEAGWPLLAFGNRGLGRVGAFAADLGGEAGAEFRGEAAFPGRLAQWLQTVLPAQPLTAPLSLLTAFAVAPVAPTPRDVEALQALAGAAPVAPGPVPTTRQLVRRLLPATSAAAPWLAACLVLLAAGERWLAARALRLTAGA